MTTTSNDPKTSVSEPISQLPVRLSVDKKMELKNNFHRQSCLCSESLFRSLYNLELERAECTGKPFLFVLIDISRLDTPEIIRWLMPLEKCLLDNTHAHDWKGWHRRGRCIGIIYTEPPCIKELLLRTLILDSARPLIGYCRIEKIGISISYVNGRGYFLEVPGMEQDACSMTSDRMKPENRSPFDFRHGYCKH